MQMKRISWLAVAALAGCQPLVEQRSIPAEKNITVNGTSLTYLDQGTGMPVVFVHGGMSDYRVWDAQRAAIAAKYRFIAPTQRYFGTRPWPDSGEGFTQETHVADLAALIDALKIEPAYLVGWSYGAYTAAAVALEHPHLVRGLFLYEPPMFSILAGSSQSANPLHEFRQRAAGMSTAETTRLLYDFVNGSPGSFDALPSTDQSILLDNARTVPLQLAVATIPVTCERLAKLTIPVVIAKGESTRDAQRQLQERLHGCIPGSQLVTISGARHDAPMVHPAAFNRAVLAALGNAERQLKSPAERP